jgi:hypothetical protein
LEKKKTIFREKETRGDKFCTNFLQPGLEEICSNPLKKNDKNYEKKFEKNIFQPTYKNTRKNKAKKKKKKKIIYTAILQKQKTK